MVTNLNGSCMKSKFKMNDEPLRCFIMLQDTIPILYDAPTKFDIAVHDEEILNIFKNFRQYREPPQWNKSREMLSTNEADVDNDTSLRVTIARSQLIGIEFLKVKKGHL